MKRSIFVTGTDTGIGKTVITGLLARYLLEKGECPVTQKWVQTGSGVFPADLKIHLKLMGKNKNYLKGYLKEAAPYCLKFAASPHLAAEMENKHISRKKVIKSFKTLSQRFDRVIVEGAGGVLVPFNKKDFLINLAKELDLAVLLVSGNRLGAINQTLISIEAIRSSGLELLGVIFNNLPGQNTKILADNIKVVKRISKEEVFGALPWEKSGRILYGKFKPCAARIIRKVDR